MWRRALAAMVVLTAVIGAATANAGTAPSASGGSHLIAHDVFGLDTLVLQHFGFSANLKVDGTATGWFDYRDIEDGSPFSAGGPVICLTVIDRDAWIGGTITKSNDSTLVGLGGWWHVTNRGAGAGSPPDITTFLGVGSLADTAAFCAEHPAYRFPFEIEGGNIQVRG